MQGLPKSRSMLAGNSAYDPAATFLIQRVAGTGSSGTITFSNIPSTYKHLQIRMMANDGGNNNIGIRFNGDSATNYASHILEGSGTAASASGLTSVNRALYVGQATSVANIYGVSIVDVLDYGSTTKNKTVRSFVGWDSNNGGDGGTVRLSSGLWLSTAAVTSISLVDLAGSFNTTSTFALYGFTG